MLHVSCDSLSFFCCALFFRTCGLISGNPPITKLDRSDNPYVLEPLGTPPSPAKPAKLKFSRDASEPYLLLPPEHDEAQFLEKFGTFTTPPDLDKFLRKVTVLNLLIFRLD